MEFIMTYGWAILVVLAAIGALSYFGVLNPDFLVPDKCFFGQGLPCIEKPSIVAGDDNIDIVLMNGLSHDILMDVNQEIAIIKSDGCHDSSATLEQVVVKDGEGQFHTYTRSGNDVADIKVTWPFTLRIHCPDLVRGKKLYADVSFKYLSEDTLMEHYTTGHISGRVG
ncbi:MAG: hypothetical protein KJ709_04335 [Nanoarchaeota archaeon]|nr:hypothetical protein [Nanoarchaeota archaeon]